MDLPVDEHHVFERLSAANLEEAALLAVDVLGGDSPVHAHLHADIALARKAARIEHAHFVEEGLSVVARDRSTSRLVGFRFARDYASYYGFVGRSIVALCHALDRRRIHARLLLPRRIRELAPWIVATDAMHRCWRDDVFGGSLPRPGKVVLLHGGGVARSAERRGLLVRMTEVSERLACERGFERAVVICTGARSQALLRDRMGYRPRVEIAYDEMRFQRERPFVGIRNPRTDAPEHCAMLLDRELVPR